MKIQKKELAKIQDLLNEVVSEGKVAGINAVVIQSGKEQGYFQAGYADMENQIPMERNTICRLYSMSKPVTAAAVMILLEEGKIDLNTPVSSYIKGLEETIVSDSNGEHVPPRPIWVRDLLNMTAGYNYGGDQTKTQIETSALFQEMMEKLDTKDAITTMEFARRQLFIPVEFNPGTKAMYGTCADILGALVEAVSGMRFGEFLEEYLFKPLGMKDTGFYVPAKKQKRLAKVYEKTGDGLKLFTVPNLAISNHMKKRPAFESGGAGLVSTLDDYAKFNQMLIQGGTYNGKRILSEKTVEFMTGAYVNEAQMVDMKEWDSMSGYSYGNLMRIMTHPEHAFGLGSYGEYGWDGWLGAYMINIPQEDISILVMQQLVDAGTTEWTRRLRNLVYASLK